MSSLYYLMQRAVDYAGLFPPAALPMSQVVSNYAKYLRCDEAPMLGRLIVPATQLESFESAAAEFLEDKKPTLPWSISALVPPIEIKEGNIDSEKFDAAFNAIQSFNEKHAQEDQPRTVVDAVELKTLSLETLAATVKRLTEDKRLNGISAFLEIPHQEDPSEFIELIANQAVVQPIFAKIRTGGVTEALIPPPAQVARFIRACAKHEIGFKATAGLHHPIRAEQKLTYEEDAPTGTMHGFLNVFVATAFAYEHQLDAQELETIIAADSAEAFGFEEDRITWNGLSVSNQSIADTRTHGIISFGSCSFVEPTEELPQLPNISRQSVFAVAIT